jgi:hypothetical protein
MSYNIDNWKIRSLHLELPRNFDFQAWLATQPAALDGVEICKGSEDAHIEIDEAQQTWKLLIPLEFDELLTGVVLSNKLVANALELMGEFSGFIYSDVLLPLFVEFKGNLDAIVVWEGGDTIDHLTIKDGVVTENEIE